MDSCILIYMIKSYKVTYLSIKDLLSRLNKHLDKVSEHSLPLCCLLEKRCKRQNFFFSLFFLKIFVPRFWTPLEQMKISSTAIKI